MAQETLETCVAAVTTMHQDMAYQEAILSLSSLGKELSTHLIRVVCVIVNATIVDDVPQATNEVPTLRNNTKAR